MDFHSNKKIVQSVDINYVLHLLVFYIYYIWTLIFPPVILLHLVHVKMSTSKKVNLKLGIVECMKSKVYNTNSWKT